jgi:hypothetical protein
MSRAYRISVKESSTREIKGDDEICTQLEILEILPREQMGKLMTEELIKRGFEQQEDGTLVRTKGNVTVSIDPRCGEVIVKVDVSEKLTIEVKDEGVGYDDVGPGQRELEQRIKEKLRAEIDKKAAKAGKELQGQATQELEERLKELQPELSEIVNKVTREALKQKAQQLGNVKEIHENEQSGELTIKVEV